MEEQLIDLLSPMVRDLVQQEFAKLSSVLDKRAKDLLSTPMAIQQYQGQGVTSAYKLRRLEQEYGLKSYGSNPKMYIREELEAALLKKIQE